MKRALFFLPGLVALTLSGCGPSATPEMAVQSQSTGKSAYPAAFITRCDKLDGPTLSLGVVSTTLEHNCDLNGNTKVTLSLALYENGALIAHVSKTEVGPHFGFSVTTKHKCASPSTSNDFQAIGTVTLNGQKTTYKSAETPLMCS